MNKKGQIKIQEMAFVLIAVMIFFALAALFYFSLRSSSLEKSTQELYENNAKSLAAALSRYPELVWGECTNCLDFDKALAFKEVGNSSQYSRKWELDYLMIEKVYPKTAKKECMFGNYPSCSYITLINSTSNQGSVSFSFVTICRFDSTIQQETCELGKIYTSGKNIKSGGIK